MLFSNQYLTQQEVFQIVTTHIHSYWLYLQKNHAEFYNHIQTLPGKTFNERLYGYFNCGPHFCQHCGSSKLMFKGLKRGYAKYCSRVCTSHSDATKIGQQKLKNDPIRLKARNDKSKQTALDKYGVDHYTKLDSVKEQKRISSTNFYRKKYPMEINGRSRKQYQHAVRWLTNTIYKKYKDIIDPAGKRSKEWVVDHIYSLSDGFYNNVPLDIICHPTNLRLIHNSDNSRKRDKSGKTLKQLYEDCAQFQC